MDRAWQDARTHGWSREPVVEVLIPSTLDDSLAPDGQHVASLFCQHVAPELPDGKSWDDRPRRGRRSHDRDRRQIRAGLRGQRDRPPDALSPLDLERQFGLLGGDIFHGALTLNQLFSARPMLGHADYRGPLKGLYHCGSGAHPGGGVTGAPGHNAARAILGDHRALVRLMPSRPFIEPISRDIVFAEELAGPNAKARFHCTSGRRGHRAWPFSARSCPAGSRACPVSASSGWLLRRSTTLRHSCRFGKR